MCFPKVLTRGLTLVAFALAVAASAIAQQYVILSRTMGMRTNVLTLRNACANWLARTGLFEWATARSVSILRWAK